MEMIFNKSVEFPYDLSLKSMISDIYNTSWLDWMVSTLFCTMLRVINEKTILEPYTDYEVTVKK